MPPTFPVTATELIDRDNDKLTPCTDGSTMAAPSRPTSTLPTPTPTPSPKQAPATANATAIGDPSVTRCTTPETPPNAAGYLRACAPRALPPPPKPRFDVLPLSVQSQIFDQVLDDPLLRPNADMFVVDHEPRCANPAILALMNRKPVVAALRQLSRLAYALANELLYAPAVVTSMKQLCVLAGSRYEDADRKRKRRDGDIRPLRHRRVQGERMKDLHGRDRTVRELVIIMGEVPGGQRPRFPWWYVADHMRYDLEVLQVEKLTVAATAREQLKAVLCAAIPNHETIRHLHLELIAYNTHFPPHPDYLAQYLHNSPDTQHLCPYILQLTNLETLHLRNLTVCDHLFPPFSWPNLKLFKSFSVNGLPGLCRSRSPPRECVFTEVSSFHHALLRQFTEKPELLGEVWISDDEYCETSGLWIPRFICLLWRRIPGAPVLSDWHAFDRLGFGTSFFQIDYSGCHWRPAFPEGSGGIWEKEWGGLKDQFLGIVSPSDFEGTEEEWEEEVGDEGLFDIEGQEKRLKESQVIAGPKEDVNRPLRII